MAKINRVSQADSLRCSGKACCFFKAMKNRDPNLKRSLLCRFFHDMPHVDDPLHVLVMSGLWSLAMSNPDDPTLPSLPSFFTCMANLIRKALSDPHWLHKDQNIYIPYYAAHIIGSYTINSPRLVAKAADVVVVPPLVELLKGRLSWVEQRVAVRALGHLASFDSTFEAVSSYEEEVVKVSMRLVFDESVKAKKKEKYQSELLSRGLGDEGMEEQRAEEWASQLQCWSIQLLNCFASKQRSINAIVSDGRFLTCLCNIWGSPSGVGLLRILCRSKAGRKALSQHKKVVLSLCNLSRSSDDFQYMGIDCLLLLLRDENTRDSVLEGSVLCLVDLVELGELGRRRGVGGAIARALLVDYKDGLYCDKEVEKALGVVWDLKVGRRREARMGKGDLEKRRGFVSSKRQQGNEQFWGGDINGAMGAYSEALELCPLRLWKERLVLYSNRAQCHLLLREADEAISDATRALSLSKPANSHGKSLWRRSQAYDVKGLAKESLLDCLMFINVFFGSDEKRQCDKVPYYAIRMICKQMSSVGLFSSASSAIDGESDDIESIGKDDKQLKMVAFKSGVAS
ncbi:hypothetical protein QJS04_geneDACA006311 [Acorus gramineus]|uniref:ARM repeat N-terminal plant domain-containing protein n=1 Tax=Acorus gramineus TaxID=55184 RepID=A0AAV9AUP2_ACOGR|nr:hypothetical protein QJS04_geneDACA006311 [Acorus gramineus]